MRTLCRIFAMAAVGTSLALGGCASERVGVPTYYAEEPVGSWTWTKIPAEPAWVANPPAHDGYLVFVVEGVSDGRGIAATVGADREATSRVRDALTPIVGAENAARAAASVPASLRLVRRACKEELTTREVRPGAGMCTAWAIWELPVDAVVATLPEDARARARAALLASR
jgi:hypothetical protein